MPDDKRDAEQERATPTERSGSPFPDPSAPKKPGEEVEVLPGQAYPTTGHPDDGGVRPARGGDEIGNG